MTMKQNNQVSKKGFCSQINKKFIEAENMKKANSGIEQESVLLIKEIEETLMRKTFQKAKDRYAKNLDKRINTIADTWNSGVVFTDSNGEEHKFNAEEKKQFLVADEKAILESHPVNAELLILNSFNTRIKRNMNTYY